VEGPPSAGAGAGAGAAGNGIGAVGSTEGDSDGPGPGSKAKVVSTGPGSRMVSTTRCMTRPGSLDRVDDSGDGLGPAEPNPAAGWAKGAASGELATDAISGESDTSGATSSGSASTPI
jgi:hypothetical protein